MIAHINCRIKHSSVHWVVAFPFFLPAVNAESLEEKSVQLDRVRAQIETVEVMMEKARSETDRLQLALKENELAAGQIAISLGDTEAKLQGSSERLIALNEEKMNHSTLLAKQKRILGDQIHAAYIMGHNDYIKLLLNQEEPSKVGRALAYHDYYNRVRAQYIEDANIKISKIVELENVIEREHEALRGLKQQQIEEKEAILISRNERENILTKLRQEFAQQALKLQSLKRQEQEINRLFSRLIDNQQDTAVFKNLTPFAKLKGKLDWPVHGDLLTQFGGNKPNTQLKWQGVVIDAVAGIKVHAISDGRVVFADWFRNLGLLIIIDHGDQYMSLYGYNQSLLKKTGDWVLPGEAIAFAGDSGGQLRSGVYFEIRHSGTPVNPKKWCRN